MIVHKNITINGRVHGVGFRFSARNAAKSFGIKGYVKNKIDGSVYIEAEGLEKNVNLFIKWCYKGSENAYVESIDVNDSSIKNYASFEIKF